MKSTYNFPGEAAYNFRDLEWADFADLRVSSPTPGRLGLAVPGVLVEVSAVAAVMR